MYGVCKIKLNLLQWLCFLSSKGLKRMDSGHWESRDYSACCGVKELWCQEADWL